MRVPLGIVCVALGTPLLLAGCGTHHQAARTATADASSSASSSATVAAPTTTAPATSTPPSVTSPATSAPPSALPTAAPSPCTTAQLAFTLGGTTAAGGRTSVPLRLRNATAAACTVHGWADVDFVDSGGMQVGPAAAEVPGTEATVVLAPGATATATLAYAPATTAAGCDADTASGLLVFAPGQSASSTVADQVSLCTDQADRPTITTVTATGS